MWVGGYEFAPACASGFCIPATALKDAACLGAAMLLGCTGYGAVVLTFRRRLPLAR